MSRTERLQQRVRPFAHTIRGVLIGQQQLQRVTRRRHPPALDVEHRARLQRQHPERRTRLLDRL
jgi:hypothetical protein